MCHRRPHRVTDGTASVEFTVADGYDCERLFSLAVYPLPGGEFSFGGRRNSPPRRPRSVGERTNWLSSTRVGRFVGRHRTVTSNPRNSPPTTRHRATASASRWRCPPPAIRPSSGPRTTTLMLAVVPGRRTCSEDSQKRPSRFLVYVDSREVSVRAARPSSRVLGIPGKGWFDRHTRCTRRGRHPA